MQNSDKDTISIDFSDLPLESSMAYTTYTTYTTGNLTSPDYILTGSNGIDWGTVTVSADTVNTLHVNGDASIEGDLKIKGKSVADSLDRIEERLAILRPNEELEAKWENLRGLRQAYMELEAEIIEKEKIWGILKK